MPSKVGQAAVICTGCSGNNFNGEANDGKPTYQFAAPLTAFAGRYVDSNNTLSVQHIGMRTARAGFIHLAPTQRGTAPPRLYIQIGQALGVYSLNTFFTTRLAAGLSPINVIGTGAGYGGRNPLEKIAIFDAHVYPESTHSGGWEVPVADNQDRLWDMDYDDRGYVYMAYDEFGWGIVRDAGETNSAHLGKVVQVIGSELGDLAPRGIFTLKVNSRYYAVISDVTVANKSYIYDVTSPSSPSSPSIRSGALSGFVAWAKDDANQVLAVFNGQGKILLYTYDDYIRGASPFDEVTSSSTSKYLKSLSFDDQGNLWVTERGARSPETNVLHKLTRTGSGYTHTTLSPYPAPFFPKFMNANAGYVAVGGTINHNGKEVNQLYLFKMEGSGLRLLDTDDFFRKYYHSAPSGYAQPGGFVNSPVGAQIVKQGTKTYLLYSSYGLGDVFQLGADGPVLTATVKPGPYGTTNPNAPGAQAGPFPGDIVTFNATVNPAATHTLNWNFANPDAGTANTRSSSTGADITHQFTGLNTSSKITSAKTVTATASTDSELNSSVSVSLKVPEPRIAIKATGEVITASNFEAVYGDKFVDASDGTIESHVATWKVGATQTALRPDQEISVGGLGQRSVEFTGSYGKYDPNTLALPSLAYNAIIAAKGYEVKPFIAKLNQASRTGTTVTYSATARYTTDTSVLSATQWTVRWTLKTGPVETASKTETVAVGNVPDFPFEKALLLTGSTIKLEITVPEANVSDPSYASYAVSTTVTVPDPVIQLTNCGFVNDNCQIKAISGGGQSIASWQLSWTVKRGATVVKSGTGNPLATFKLTQSGSYTVSVTETVFDTVAVTLPFEVGASLCTAPPTDIQLAINASCSSCSVGQTVSFSASLFQYTPQACDEYSWNFGDGQTATGQNATHSFATAKSYTVRLTVKNSFDTTGTTTTKTITVGGGSGPTCTAPSNINISYSSTQGCAPNVDCKTGDSIKFTAKRGSSSLQSCDQVSWDFGDGQQSGNDSPTKSYSAPGTYTISAIVQNELGTSAPVTRTIKVIAGTGSCGTAPNEANVSLAFRGKDSNCTKNNGTHCTPGEQIDFTASFFQYTPQACDRFEWNFGDGATSTSQNPSHTYAANRTAPANVSLKVYTTSNTTGVTLNTTVGFGTPALELPVLSMASFPTAGSKGSPITFTANSNISATGWAWDFGDGQTDNTQGGFVGTSNSVTHTYVNSGTYSVTVRARNAADVATAPKSQAVGSGLVISDTPEYKFLLPVVAHGPGQNGSVWRTDVQIYTPDPTVTPANPLRMTAMLRDIPATLEVRTPTYTYEDFMRAFTTGNDSGPVIITVRSQYVPQIWTRTYNQTDAGTFGQFMPAVRIDAAAGSGSAFGSGKYYMAGLHHDSDFRTNLGFVNPNPQNVNVTVKVYDDERFKLGQFTLQLAPYQLDQFPINADKAVKNLPADRPFSVEIEVPTGQWLIGYASKIDQKSNDPTTFPMIRESELSMTEYGQGVIPGVGHVGDWRSDVTIFNPDAEGINIDLAYYDQSGTKRAEAKGVPIGPFEFVQYKDILRQGVLGNVPDSLGVLRVTVSDTFPPTRYPLTFARTYNDKGTGPTFGQGISGFAAGRTNVKQGKPALVPGVRSDSKYYTNVGLVNPTNATVNATVKRLDPNSGAEHIIQQHTLAPNQSIVALVDLGGGLTTASLKIEANGNLWAFCSIVDRQTLDAENVVAATLP